MPSPLHAEALARVAVFARVRPPLVAVDGADAATTSARVRVVPPTAVLVLPSGAGAVFGGEEESMGAVAAAAPGGSISLRGGAPPPAVQRFAFEGAFPGGASQAEVYRRAVAEAVGEALSGVNAVVLVHGQSGAGKTHTVFGPSDHDPAGVTARDASLLGLIPRAMHDLYERAAVRANGSGTVCSYSIAITYAQLYKEQWVDLLAHAAPQSALSSGHGGRSRVPNPAVDPSKLSPATCTHEVADDLRAVLALLQRGARHKALAATALNSHSSRGHTIFQATISCSGGRSSGAPHTIVSTLTLVDLAGSERLSRVGHRPGSALYDETCAINKSLHSLGCVFAALASAVLKQRRVSAAMEGGGSDWGDGSGSTASFVPWRASRLTRFLQGCLAAPPPAAPLLSAGRWRSPAPPLPPSSTLTLLVCLSPTDASLNETISSLHFASRARAITEALAGNVAIARALLDEQSYLYHAPQAPRGHPRGSGHGEDAAASPGSDSGRNRPSPSLIHGTRPSSPPLFPAPGEPPLYNPPIRSASERSALRSDELDAVVDIQRTQIGALTAQCDDLRAAQVQLAERLAAAEADAFSAREEAARLASDAAAARAEAERARHLDRLAARASQAVLATTLSAGVAAAGGNRVRNGGAVSYSLSPSAGGIPRGGAQHASEELFLAHELSASVLRVEDAIGAALEAGDEEVLRTVIDQVAAWPGGGGTEGGARVQSPKANPMVVTAAISPKAMQSTDGSQRTALSPFRLSAPLLAPLLQKNVIAAQEGAKQKLTLEDLVLLDMASLESSAVGGVKKGDSASVIRDQLTSPAICAEEVQVDAPATCPSVVEAPVSVVSSSRVGGDAAVRGGDATVTQVAILLPQQKPDSTNALETVSAALARAQSVVIRLRNRNLLSESIALPSAPPLRPLSSSFLSLLPPSTSSVPSTAAAPTPGTALQMLPGGGVAVRPLVLTPKKRVDAAHTAVSSLIAPRPPPYSSPPSVAATPPVPLVTVESAPLPPSDSTPLSVGTTTQSRRVIAETLPIKSTAAEEASASATTLLASLAASSSFAASSKVAAGAAEEEFDNALIATRATLASALRSLSGFGSSQPKDRNLASAVSGAASAGVVNPSVLTQTSTASLSSVAASSAATFELRRTAHERASALRQQMVHVPQRGDEARAQREEAQRAAEKLQEEQRVADAAPRMRRASCSSTGSANGQQRTEPFLIAPSAVAAAPASAPIDAVAAREAQLLDAFLAARTMSAAISTPAAAPAAPAAALSTSLPMRKGGVGPTPRPPPPRIPANDSEMVTVMMPDAQLVRMSRRDLIEAGVNIASSSSNLNE